MQSETLKNRVKDLQADCDNMRNVYQNSDEREWQKAMELTLEQKCEENNQFRISNEELRLERAALIEDAERVAAELESSKETIAKYTALREEHNEMIAKCNTLREQQESMISVDYLNQLKEEVFAKSRELEESSKQCQKEHEEVKFQLEGYFLLIKTDISDLFPIYVATKSINLSNYTSNISIQKRIINEKSMLSFKN